MPFNSTQESKLCQHASLKLIFIKPGPAISTDKTISFCDNDSLIILASPRGLVSTDFERIIAAFVAMSP